MLSNFQTAAHLLLVRSLSIFQLVNIYLFVRLTNGVAFFTSIASVDSPWNKPGSRCFILIRMQMSQFDQSSFSFFSHVKIAMRNSGALAGENWRRFQSSSRKIISC
jgi:hypothetical protein